MEEKILEMVARQDYAELCEKVSNLSYETAFKELDGYNLTADPITCNGEFISVNEFFDVRYKHIETAIFRIDGNRCEVWEEFSLCVHYTA